MEVFGKEKADDVKVLVMSRGKPASVLKRFFERPPPIQQFWRREKRGRPEEHRMLLGNDRGLQMAVVAHEMLHYLKEIRQRLHAVHQVLRGDIATTDDF